MYFDEKLSGYGLYKYETGEGMFCLREEPKFFYKNFKSYLSEGMVEYLRLRQEEGLREAFSDMQLVISFDDLSDRIITWENYLKKYPAHGAETEDAQRSIDLYLSTYLRDKPDISLFMFELPADLKKSYGRFLTTYPDSKYCEAVREKNEEFNVEDYMDGESEAEEVGVSEEQSEAG